MAISKIQYDDKVAINIDSTIPDINKCNASDLNEIKSVVNNNADEMPTADDLVNASDILIEEQGQTTYTISDTLDNGAMNIKLKGNTLQNGTPTPSSPIPINNVSGDNDIVVSNGASDTTTYNIDLPVENLIDYDNMKSSGGYGDEGYLPSNPNYTTIQYIKVQPNTKYTITTNIDITKYSALRVSDFNSSKTFIRRNAGIPITSQTQTFITSSDAVYIALSFWTGGTASMSDITQAQLEQGSKSNTYTPYGTTPIELNKIGTYQDYIYKDSDKWYLHKEIGKIVLDDDTQIDLWAGAQSQNNTIGFRYQTTNMINIQETDSNIYQYCNYFNSNSRINMINQDIQGVGNAWGGRYYFRISRTLANDLASIKSWFTTNKPILTMVLATPTNTEITYTPLIEQLESIKNAMSKEGTTNVNQVNNDAPFILDVKALQNNNSGSVANIILQFYK